MLSIRFDLFTKPHTKGVIELNHDNFDNVEKIMLQAKYNYIWPLFSRVFGNCLWTKPQAAFGTELNHITY